MTDTNSDKSINHVEAMKLLPLYLAGELDNKISNRVRQHLENCQECRMEAVALKDTLPELQIEAVQENLTEPKVEQILRRSRLRALFSGGIISFMIGAGILSSLFLLMFLTKPLLYAKGNEIMNVVNLGVPLTQPGVFVSGSGGKVGYWGSFKAEGKLKRCIGGNRSWDAGKITGTVNLWGPKLFNYEWIADRQTHYIFKLPQSNNNQVSEKNVRLLWEGLERLPSGTAAEMAFSLDNYYDLKEVPKLPGEHLVISWYALDTGEQLITDQENYYSPKPLGINPHEYWKHIPEQPKKKEKFSIRLSNWLRGFESYVSAQPPFPDSYIEKVAWLAERPELLYAVAPSVQSSIPIEQRYQYLKDHGLKTYGIVVHGPADELLELQNMPQLMEPQLGPVVWWLPDTLVY
jgi:hypothetical protein